MKLHDLKPAPGSVKRKKRVGRGMASGKGKTSTRGMKGQNARSGGGKGPYFEGGQLPLVRRLPFKRGFNNFNRVEYTPVNLDRLQEKFGESGQEITPETLVESGIIKKTNEAIAILGRGELSAPLSIKAHRFSKSAREKIEAVGGTAEVLPLQR
jgi:large subunit ribosomal protein L15